MRDEFDGMTVFVRVAEKRSFSAAASDLGVSGSAVSQTVQQLEQRLGVRLLQRSTRSVGLTEAGERLYASVAPAFTEIRGAVEALNELRERPAGTVRMTLARGAGPLIYDALSDFSAEFPEVKLELCFDDGLTDIVAEGLDAGVRLGEVLDKDMVAVDVTGPQRMAVLGSPAYFGRHPKPKHPRDLLHHECVGYRRTSNSALYHWEFDEAGKDFEIALTPRIVSNDLEHMRHSALRGLGLVFLFEDLVRSELHSGALVRVLKEFCSPFPGFFLYYPSRAYTPLKLRVLADFLRKRARKRSAKG
ncbi:MAG: LysR family transcriptional regulator [Myxococcales bacterium]|jgi:DNA-binding transcriptional LysR family regulator